LLVAPQESLPDPSQSLWVLLAFCSATAPSDLVGIAKPEIPVPARTAPHRFLSFRHAREIFRHDSAAQPVPCTTKVQLRPAAPGQYINPSSISRTRNGHQAVPRTTRFRIFRIPTMLYLHGPEERSAASARGNGVLM